MKKFKLTVNNAPTPKSLEQLAFKVARARAGNRSELSGKCPPFAIIQVHHIFHKPNFRLRFELSNLIVLTKEEHARYHYYEKCAFKADRQIADDMRQKFLDIRGTTEENLMLFKRGCGGTDKFALQEYLNLKLKEFEAEAL